MPFLPSNRHLLERFRAGDPEALAEVYSHYAPDLVRFLQQSSWFQWRGTTGRFGGFRAPLESADAVQEVFVRAFSERARLSYDGLKPFGGWLNGIARHYVLDEFRKRYAAADAEIIDAAQGMSSAEAISPESSAEESEAARLVEAFRSGLEGMEARLYDARFVQGNTQQEAAGLLGMTRIRLRRVELKLRRRLLEHLKTNGYLEDVEMSGWGLSRLLPVFSGRRAGQ